MSNRKHTTVAGTTSDSAAAQENLNVLYTAHQVHTMAQLVYRHLAGGWQSRAPWAPNASGGFPAAFATTGNTGTFPMRGAVPGTMAGTMSGATPAFQAAPPALFYWYP